MRGAGTLHGGKFGAQRLATVIVPHFDALYRVAYRLTRSVQAAEDLLQETCIRACAQLSEFDRQASLQSWLLGHMYRLFVDANGRYGMGRVRSINRVRSTPSIGEEAGSAQHAYRTLLEKRLDSAWQELESDERALLALHDMEGSSLSELEEMTAIGQRKLRLRLHRARIRLGKSLRRKEATAGCEANPGDQFIRCKDVVELLDEGAERQFVGTWRPQITEHLLICDHCRSLYGAIQLLRTQREMPVPKPDRRLFHRTMRVASEQDIQAKQTPRPPVPSGLRRSWWS